MPLPTLVLLLKESKKKAKSVGYPDSKFSAEVSRLGVVAACRTLIRLKNSVGFNRLLKSGLTSASIEAIVWDNKVCRGLFTGRDLKLIQRRLTDCGYAEGK